MADTPRFPQDITDPQYRTFRMNLPYMTALLIFHPLARKLYNSIFPVPSARENNGAARLNQRASFDFAFALLFLVALHGFSALKVLLILYTNYQLGIVLPRKYVPLATWVFNIGILFANDLCNGYQFRSIASLVSPPAPTMEVGATEPLLLRLGTWLDSYGGILSRWEIMFNITILRLISFNMDRYWAANSGDTSALEVCPPPQTFASPNPSPQFPWASSPPRRNGANTSKKKQLDPANLSEKDRVSLPADTSDYSFRNYVAYAIYAPLYIAGPIFTFNDYISQSKYRPATISAPQTVRYAIRFLLALLAMELILHHIYVGAIAYTSPDWTSYTASQLCLLSYFNLHIIWLKLLLPWRLFRLWSLVDGIDPPENMVRCVSDNFSTLHFWRAWHRSYNRWLIRYLYVPLGGARFDTALNATRSVVTYVLVFTFVALWHDIKMRLLIWGWLVVLFLLPEVAAKRLFPAARWRNHPTAYRMLCGVGALVNVFSMMSANLVGFAVGVEGMKSIIRGIFEDHGGKSTLPPLCCPFFLCRTSARL